MARGDVVVFNKAKLEIAKGAGGINLSDSASFKMMLINSVPVATEVNHDRTTYTEVSPIGTNYTAGGVALNPTWTESSGVCTFDSAVDPTWLEDAGGPNDIRALLIFSTTAVGNDCVAFMDLTSGGPTPISLQLGDLPVTWSASGIFTLE